MHPTATLGSREAALAATGAPQGAIPTPLSESSPDWFVHRDDSPIRTPMQLFELLEPDRQPISIRAILNPPRPFDQFSGDSLKAEFEERAIVNVEQPIGDVNPIIGVNAD